MSASGPDPFTGVWVFSHAQSALSTPLPQSWVLRITASASEISHREEISTADGSQMTVVMHVAFDGEDYPVTGSPLMETMACTRNAPQEIAGTGKIAGAVTLTDTLTVSPDGEVLTLKYSVFDGAREIANGTGIFDKTTRDRSKDGPKAAAELMRELELDPEFRARELRRQSEQLTNVENYRRAVEPLLSELNEAGIKVHQIGDLRFRPDDNGRALSILVSWLPRISYGPLKQDVVRTLSMPAAKIAARPLIQEFIRSEQAGPGLRWAIANALEVVADDSVFQEIAELACDTRWGKDREMLVMALGNMRNPRAIAVLAGLLGDEETVGHAVVALGKLRAVSARPLLENLKDHPKAWIRTEVAKALRRCDGT